MLNVIRLMVIVASSIATAYFGGWFVWLCATAGVFAICTARLAGSEAPR